jgi:hypothetical protein
MVFCMRHSASPRYVDKDLFLRFPLQGEKTLHDHAGFHAVCAQAKDIMSIYGKGTAPESRHKRFFGPRLDVVTRGLRTNSSAVNHLPSAASWKRDSVFWRQLLPSSDHLKFTEFTVRAGHLRCAMEVNMNDRV